MMVVMHWFLLPLPLLLLLAETLLAMNIPLVLFLLLFGQLWHLERERILIGLVKNR